MEEQLAKLDLNSNPEAEAEAQAEDEIGWYDIPLELREIVLEHMTTDAKRRFSMCSKDCLKKVRRSKNFLEMISLFWTESIVEMEVSIGDDFYVIFQFSQIIEQVTGYSIFGPTYYKTFMVDGDFHSIGLEYFQKFIEDAIHLENLELEVDNFPFDKVNIHHLKKLKKLRIKKTDNAEGELIDPFKAGFLNFAQVSTIENSIRLENCQSLDFAQVCELKARHICLKNLRLSTENFEQYLKFWKNGELGKDIQNVFMQTTEKINQEEILRDFETIGKHENYDGKIWFKLRNLTGETAEVSMSSNSVSMNLTTLDDEDDFEHENLEDSADEQILDESSREEEETNYGSSLEESFEIENHRQFLDENDHSEVEDEENFEGQNVEDSEEEIDSGSLLEESIQAGVHQQFWDDDSYDEFEDYGFDYFDEDEFEYDFDDFREFFDASDENYDYD
ncbi:unnamed protein product [Caenorhabditis angaria]|uniref:F-box domain-containing protein n=1 Tax=Caenorhabditis angaria TaxID=860376 RepID=A0A9P1IBW1_9PELO|nr:unnamed protein product [Caenorhabditis angaria]